jgi:hypothetical protein
MKHLVLTIHEKYVSYRMGGNCGTHPLAGDSPQKVIDYLIKIINPSSHETI